jgi:hypothetical protein
MNSSNRGRVRRGPRRHEGVRRGLPTRNARVAGASVAALLSAVVMLAVPVAAAAAKKHHAPKPDLKITVLQANFGSPAYAIVGTDGVMEPIQVRVGIRNQGHAIARSSTLDVFYQDSARQHFQVKVRVPSLKPSIHSKIFIVDIVGTKPKLGHAQLGAVADFTQRVAESDESNNFFKGERFEVIARQWNVPYFDTILTLSGAGTRTTSSQSSFHFEFSHYDHAKELYVYLPIGSITSTMVYAGGFCSGTGSLTDSKSPWGGFLHIAGDFRYYDAFVDTSSTPYTVPLTCLGGFTSSVSEAFDDLDTTASGTFPPLTNEQAAQVTGDYTDPVKRTQWKWQFHAAGL